jgi:hypothetical protein
VELDALYGVILRRRFVREWEVTRTRLVKEAMGRLNLTPGVARDIAEWRTLE